MNESISIDPAAYRLRNERYWHIYTSTLNICEIHHYLTLPSCQQSYIALTPFFVIYAKLEVLKGIINCDFIIDYSLHE